MLELRVSGEFVLLNGEMCDREHLYIEWVDYGDNMYDVHICYKNTGELFGNVAWCGIKGMPATLAKIHEIKKISGINVMQRFSSKKEE